MSAYRVLSLKMECKAKFWPEIKPSRGDIKANYLLSQENRRFQVALDLRGALWYSLVYHPRLYFETLQAHQANFTKMVQLIELKPLKF